ncbi:MAG: hypothetical protein NC338_02845 [Firmicutes bacterium]|nr:hypothetical protein [Bacillota bacterium]MCM1400872.1 hypothetical protein [Bacteroides sp.]MCM1476633.1 hypothetical protein [Bacteroides sp.]
MKKLYNRLIIAFSILIATLSSSAQEKIILLNEGNWQADNGKITYFEDGRIVSNQWFRDVNGYKLGDTPNDIIQVKPDLIAIAINWSNIIQFIDATGHAVAETEDVPNNRKLATDGVFVYVTSYGHECKVAGKMVEFTKGFVAKIDVNTFKVVSAVEVGYEPEGIALYKGKLFVANTGGYAFQEDHEYETTVSVIDAATMKVEKSIDTGQINLYGKLSQSGQYLCINSPGDYYDVMAATIILDCQAVLDGKNNNECFVKLPYAATYSCTAKDGKFYAIGSRYSYYTGGYQFNYVTIDPEMVIKYFGSRGVSSALPGTMLNDIKKMQMPYGLYVNPYTGYIYATDAAGFVEGGTLYQWSPEGNLLGKFGVYINPAHFLALNPQGESGIETVEVDECEDANAPMYNIQGIRILTPSKGQIYIQNGKKKIQQ